LSWEKKKKKKKEKPNSCKHEEKVRGEREREREAVLRLKRSEPRCSERGDGAEVTAENGEESVRPASFDRGERGEPTRPFCPPGALVLRKKRGRRRKKPGGI